MSINATWFDEAPDIRAGMHRLMGLRPERLSQIVESADEDLPTRRAAGHLLAFLGDPRLKTFAPVMLDVHSDFRMSIAKYPVTHQEFWQFLRYTNTEERPTSWSYGLFPEASANHPVYGITPAMANAYALWLSDLTGRSFQLLSTDLFAFAISPNGHRFPWGCDPVPEAANTADDDFFGTTTVGCFPEGASWCGAMDLIGNVGVYLRDENQEIVIGGRDCCQTQESETGTPKLVGIRLMESF